MPHLDVIGANVDVGVGVGTRDLVDQQSVAQHVRLGMAGSSIDLDEAAVGRASAAARDGLGHDGRRGVRCHVHHLRAGVLLLSGAGKTDGQSFAASVLPHKEAGRVLHGDRSTHVAVDPFHGAALFNDRALGNQVEHVGRPVLNGRVAHARVLLHEDLNDAGVQRVLVVDRGGAALDVVNVGPLVGDDERTLELTHGGGVNAEVRLKRDRHVHALGDVDEGSTGPGGGVQCRELVVAGGHALAEVLLEDLGVLAQTGIGVGEDDALALQVLLDLLVDDLGFILRGDAGDQTRLFSLGDAQTVIGVTDFLWEVFPVVDLTIRGAHIVLERVEVHV